MNRHSGHVTSSIAFPRSCVPVLLSLLLLFPGLALAQCPDPGCPAPNPPPAPTFLNSDTASYDTDGNYSVRGYNSLHNYADYELNNDENNRKGELYPTWSYPNNVTGKYTYYGKICNRQGGACSSFSPGGTIYVVRKPDNPSFNVPTPAKCDFTLEGAVNMPSGGYPTSSSPGVYGSTSPSHTKYFDLEESTYNSTTSTWTNWTNVSGWDESYDSESDLQWTRSVEENSSYKFRVQAYYVWYGYTSGKTGWIEKTVTTPQCTPGQPASLSVSVTSDGTVNYSWVASTAGITHSYRLQRRQQPLNGSWSGWTTIASNASSPNSDTGCPRGHYCQYQVRGENSHGKTGLWRVSSTVYVPYTQPSAPTLPVTPIVQQTTLTKYTVNWLSNPSNVPVNTGTISYEISENGSWTNVGSNTSKLYENRQPGVEYIHQVKACTPPNPTTITCSSALDVGSITVPATPSGITISNIANNGRDFRLSWPSVAGATGYKLQRFSGVDPYSVSSPVPINNADVGTTFHYRVHGYNLNAVGSYSPERIYWVPKTPDPEISLDENNLELTVNWQPSGAQHYKLQQQINGGEWTTVDNNYQQTDYSMAVESGGTYRFRVEACNAYNACSIPADETYTVPVGIPAWIAVSQPEAAGRTDVTISWQKPSGLLNGYYIQRMDLTAAGIFTLIETISNANTTIYTDDTGLQAGHDYYWRVQAYKEGSIPGGFRSTSIALRVKYPRPIISLQATVGAGAWAPDDEGEAAMAQYWAGYHGFYDVEWVVAGVLDNNGITVSEETFVSGTWEPIPTNGVDCTSGYQCSNFGPRFNDTKNNWIFNYRAKACSPDSNPNVSPDPHCAQNFIKVGVLPYPKPGIPPVFKLSAPAGSDGSYTLQWSAPASTPPNAVGDQTEPVTYYELYELVGVSEEDMVGLTYEQLITITDGISQQITHSDVIGKIENGILISPYTSEAYTGRIGGRVYYHALAACFQNTAVKGCSPPALLDIYIPYSAPTGLTDGNHNVATGSYTLSWNAPPGDPVDHYELEEKRVGDTSDPQIIEVIPGATSHPIEGNENGQSYIYRVKACNAEHLCGEYSYERTVTLEYLKPDMPSDLHEIDRDQTARKLTLGWNPPLSGSVAVQEYRLQKKAASDAEWTEIAKTPGFSAEASGLNLGVTYSFRVQACSAAIEASCGEYTAPRYATLDFLAPGIPGDLSHDVDEDNPSAGEFTVHWTAPAVIDPAVAPVTFYWLEYDTGGATWPAAPIKDQTLFGRINVSNPDPYQAADATLTGLIAGYYSVRVQACNENSGSNCSEPTTPVSVYLPKPAPGVPEWLPTDVSDEDHQARRFSVDWQKRSEDDFVDHYCLSSADGIRHTTGTSADFLNRIYGQTYNLQLQACSEAGDCSQPDTVLAGCSAWADTSVRLKFPTPEAPSGLAVQNLDAVEGNFTVVWDALNSWAPAYRYELEEQDGSGWKLLAAVEDPVHEHSVSDYEANIYRYHVRACNPDPDFDCGPWSSELQVSVTGNPVAIGYQYDVLGRLTKVLEDTAVKTGYCYDKAGNRNVVTAGGGGGDNCAGAQAPPFTMSGLHAALNPGNGYTVSWDAVPGADYYKIYLNKYDTSQPGEITVNPVVINAPATSYGTPSWFAPVWIEACDEFDVCDGRAYFNL